jgi:transcriptional regulator GlxA family with amidase domain
MFLDITKPSRYGVILFPAFQALDVFGPLDILNTVSRTFKINLSLISSTMDPVSTKPRNSAMNPAGSDFGQSILPTHTFENVPELDVLIIPGGMGMRAPDIKATVDFIRSACSSVQYVLTVCTGSGLLADAGGLDGKRATTNKASWDEITKPRPQVKWIPEARWVIDGNTWTSSGVAAGIDMTYAFIGEIYGEEFADKLATRLEYVRIRQSDVDPFRVVSSSVNNA